VIDSVVTSGRRVIESDARHTLPPSRALSGHGAPTFRIAIIFASALTVWILLFFFLPTDLPFRNDQNSYLGGAEALRAGHGYRFEQYINLPPIGMYPPGYSLWLALFWENGQPMSINSHRLEVANWLAAGAALLAFASCLFIGELPAWVCAVVLLLFGTSFVFTQLMTGLTPDVLFIAGTCVLALLVSTYNPENSDRKLTLWWFCASLLTGALCVLRMAGLAYIAGLGAYGLLKGDLRRLFRLASFVVPPCSMLLWLLHTKGVATYATGLHPSNFGGLAGYFLRSIGLAMAYCSQRWLVEGLLSVPDRLGLARAFQGVSSLAEAAAFVLGLVAFALPLFLGIRKTSRQPKDQLTFFIVSAYALELILWPYYGGARFGIPLIPFVVNLLWRGLPSRAARVVFVTLLAVNIPGNAWLSYRMIRGQEKEAPQDLAELRQAASWINATAGKGSRVAAGRDVPLTHLYEYLGRRMLANAGPNSVNAFSDVSPATQDNQWAEYVIMDPSFDTTGASSQRYKITRRFGKWMVAAPR